MKGQGEKSLNILLLLILENGERFYMAECPIVTLSSRKDENTVGNILRERSLDSDPPHSRSPSPALLLFPFSWESMGVTESEQF